MPLIQRKVGGLSLITATLFVAGEMAGSGVLALPRAIVDTGKYRLQFRHLVAKFVIA